MAKSKAVERRPLLDSVKKQEMLAVLIRNQQAFEQVRDSLNVGAIKFGMGEGMALIWKTVLAFYTKYSELPPKGPLVAELHEQLEADDNLVVDDEKPEMDEFLDYAFDDAEHGKDISKSKAHARVAVDTAAALISEVKAKSVTESLVKDGTIPVNVIDALEQAKVELEVANAISAVDIDVPYPEGWDSRGRVQLVSTGCKLLDEFFGGGLRGGEVGLFMGPYGSCKTTVTCHSVAEQIVQCREKYVKALKAWKKKGSKGKKPKIPVVVLVFTEGDKDTYRCRLLAHLARIPWKKLATMKSLKHLSKATKPAAEPNGPGGSIGTKYEKYEFPDAIPGEGFRNEQDRAAMAIDMANTHLVLIDCTDSDDAPHKIGKGGIPEVATVIHAHFRRKPNTYPIAVWIDHVSALADRICEASGEEYEKRLPTILKRMPRQAADRIGKPFQVQVMLMHQLSGESNLKGVTAKYHHAESAGSKSIGEYVDFAVVTGPTDEERRCVWDCTKHRREPPMSRMIAQVQGDFQRIDNLTETHHVSGGHKITLKTGKDYHADSVAMKKKMTSVVTEDDDVDTSGMG